MAWKEFGREIKEGKSKGFEEDDDDEVKRGVVLLKLASRLSLWAFISTIGSEKQDKLSVPAIARSKGDRSSNGGKSEFVNLFSQLLVNLSNPEIGIFFPSELF